MSSSRGDWMCGACQHINFKKRDSCQRCGYPRFGGPDVAVYLANRTEALPGDWYCSAANCGAHNYASRMSCHVCGAVKFDYSGGHACGADSGFPPGWKPGDWICARAGCGAHNYASRTECFNCRTPRGYMW